MSLAARIAEKYRRDGMRQLLRSGFRHLFGDADRGNVNLDPAEETELVDEFHRLYYYETESSDTWRSTYWMGTPVQKCPTDLFIYQEILHEVQPDVIVEAGTKYGGSAKFLADLCTLLGNGEVITIDIEEHSGRPDRENITYVTGSSTDQNVVNQVSQRVGDTDEVLVILDSDHSKEHVSEELELYADLVTTGSYMIVEDTNINGHPVLPGFGPGPMEAVEDFLGSDDRFTVDKRKEKFYLTFNPNGYLKKTSSHRH